MQLSLSNLAFTGFDGYALKNISECLGLEIFYEFGNDLYWDTLLKQIFAERLQYRLSLHGPCIATNLADPTDSHYLAQYQQALELAGRWKANFIVVHTNEAFQGDKQVAQDLVVKRLQELVTMAKNYPVQLAIENVGLRNKGTLLFDWNDYCNLLAAFPFAGALLDTGHAHVNGWQLPQVIEQLGPRLTACHLHDNYGTTDDHRPIGQGNIPWQAVFAAIRTCCPEATLVFEYAHVNLETALTSIDDVSNHYCL